jgi:polysaccharide chain length determinant protein (PEP-CTERM system associated)
MDGRIDALRKNLDELLRHFTEEHPDVVGTKRVLADLERQRKEVVDSRRKAMAARASEGRATSVDRNPVYQQLKIALADAEANVASRKGRVDELESKVSELRSTAKLRPELEEEMIQLNRDYQIQKSNYDSLVGRRESAMMTSQLEQSASVADFRVIDPPRTSNTPVAPNRLLLLGLVFGASIAAGAVASLAYSQLFPVFHSLKGLRRALQRPVLGGVSMQDSPAARQRRRLHNLIFFGGLAGLFAVFGSALVLMLLAVRTY